MTMRSTPARNSAPRKASRPMSSSDATILIRPRKPKPSSVSKASKARLLLAVMLTLGGLRMTSRRPTNTGTMEIWKAPRGISSGNSVSRLGMTWKTLRTYWERALLSCKASTSTRVNPPSSVLSLTSRYLHRCYTELPARLGRVRLRPSSGGKSRASCKN